MTALEDVAQMVRRQQGRCTRTILEEKDALVDDGLLDEAGAGDLRKVVLDAVGDFADLVVAILPTVTREDIVVNAYAIELLEAIHSTVAPSKPKVTSKE